jgi:hypothetical protein
VSAHAAVSMCASSSAGELSASDALRLQHLCDAVIALEAVRDDSGIARMVPDPSRRAPCMHSDRATFAYSPIAICRMLLRSNLHAGNRRAPGSQVLYPLVWTCQCMRVRSCCGLLRVVRLPAINALARPLPPPQLHLLRHKRRRLAIEELQVSISPSACQEEIHLLHACLRLPGSGTGACACMPMCSRVRGYGSSACELRCCACCARWTRTLRWPRLRGPMAGPARRGSHVQGPLLQARRWTSDDATGIFGGCMHAYSALHRHVVGERCWASQFWPGSLHP